MSVYMAVTPVGKRGYIISRLVFPAIISILVSAIIMRYFSLTTWALPDLLITCLLSSLLSIVLALLIVAFSHNRVEGMALTKISGAILLGLFVPFFLFSSAQYLFSLLPSFWIAKLCIDGNYLLAVPPAILTSFLWIWVLYGRFIKKLS
jgi:fluoroquinolone transport system permease protein